MKICGCILAGGRSSRFGSDKALALLGGETLLDRAIRRLAPQVEAMVINTNSTAPKFRKYGLPVIADRDGSQLGPLAGILAGLEWARLQHMQAMVTAAVDTPLFPADLVLQLKSRFSEKITVAASETGLHPTFALWSIGLLSRLDEWMRQGGSLKVTDFLASQSFDQVFFAAGENAPDPFFNANTPEQMQVLKDYVNRTERKSG